MVCIGTMAAHDRIMDYVTKIQTKIYKRTFRCRVNQLLIICDKCIHKYLKDVTSSCQEELSSV